MSPENQEQQSTNLEPEVSKGTSSTGMEENLAGLLCYVLGWLTGIIFLIIEKKSKFVKFHAMQSLVTFGVLSIIWYILGGLLASMFVPSVSELIITGGTAGFGMYRVFIWLSWLVGLAMLILWIFLMVKAYQGEKFKLPIAGNIAENFANK
jgi:uncharacterized membrane protein